MGPCQLGCLWMQPTCHLIVDTRPCQHSFTPSVIHTLLVFVGLKRTACASFAAYNTLDVCFNDRYAIVAVLSLPQRGCPLKVTWCQSARPASLSTQPTRENQRSPIPSPRTGPPHPRRFDLKLPTSDSAHQHKLTAQRPPHGGVDVDFRVERLCLSRLAV